MRRMTDDEKRGLGQRIKSFRKQKGLSQEQLAGLVGNRVGTISKYEQGYRIPNVGMLRLIAAALDCGVAELAGAPDEVIDETLRFDDAVTDYIGWLRGVHIMLATPGYEDASGKDKTAIIVDIEGVPLDIGESIDDIMRMSKEHFMLLAKQFGKNIFKG